MNKENEQLEERYLRGEEMYHGPLLHVYHDRVILPDGHETGRDYIRHIGAVCVIPVTDDNRAVVERQFRYPAGMVITEIPAGKLDSADEDRLSAAKRELLEETGYTADEWISLGEFYPAAAYSSERISMYIARALHEGERRLDEGEFLNVELVPLDKLVEQVMNGEIPDLKTQAAILKAARILGI